MRHARLIPLLAMAATCAAADDPGAAPPQELVVTASRGDTDARESSVPVTVIDAPEVARSVSATVDGVLKRLPGVATTREFVAECGPGREITLRGVPDQKRTLVLVDGVPMNDGFNGAVNWSLIPNDAVERIEVVPGPMSALYGSGAMGGVINILTRAPGEPTETSARASAGSFGTYAGGISHGGTAGRHGCYVNLRGYTTDGYMKVEDPAAYHVQNDRTDWSALGKYVYEPHDDARLTLSGYAADEEYSRGRIFNRQHNSMSGGALAYDGVTGTGAAYSALLFGHYKYRDVEVSIAPSYDFLEHTEEECMYKAGPQLRLSLPVGASHVVTVGLDAAYDRFDKDNIYKTSARRAESGGEQVQMGLYAQDEMRETWGDHHVILTLGVRGDYFITADGYMRDSGSGLDMRYDDQTGCAVNPKAGLVYQYAEDTTLRAALGTSFSAPTLSERYTLFERGPNKIYGNPELDPERSVSCNLGVEQRLHETLLLRVDGYYTRGRDFVSTRLVTPPFTRINDNITAVEMRGVDLGLRARLAGAWGIYAGYTYNESTVLEDEVKPANEGNALPFQPTHKGLLGIVFDDPQYGTVDLGATYVGKRYSSVENTAADRYDGYVSLDLHLARLIARRTTVTLDFENLLDERYEVYSLPLDESYAPGLIVTAGIQHVF